MPKRPSANPPEPPKPRLRTSRRGPAPKSVRVHKLEGTYQPCRHAKRLAEPEAEGELETMPAPEWLTDRQQQYWTEFLVDAPKGILRRIDWGIYAAYVQTWDRYVKAVTAQQKLDDHQALPFLLKSKSGLTLSPYMRVQNHCIAILLRLAAELGFSPAARAHLAQPINEPDDETGSGWEVLRQLRVIPGGKG